MAHLALRARVTHVLGMGPDQIRSEGMGMARGSGWGAAQVVHTSKVLNKLNCVSLRALCALLRSLLGGP